MAKTFAVYPVGTPGQPWDEPEREQWRQKQSKKRDYFNDVVSVVHRYTHVEVFQYGSLDYRQYGSSKFPLFGMRSLEWNPANRLVCISGGVHGYETSGVLGALLFVEKYLAEFADNKLNVLVLPCVSPWGYENIQRWNPLTIDPNRCFKPDQPGCEEAALAMACIAEHVNKSSSILLHMDLHETTDTDNSEFIPSRHARDGVVDAPYSEIPDGFYLIGKTHSPELKWHEAIISAVAKVTHIAPPDEEGNIVGVKETSNGIIITNGRPAGICSAHSDARFVTTTEVYPDSPRTTPEQCNEAQAVAVRTGLLTALQMTSQ